MGRWDPDARGRLMKAAMELYAERGFELTTVADIAAKARLTERTFFRHFTDKREVLFSGSAALQELMVCPVAAHSDDSDGPVRRIRHPLVGGRGATDGRARYPSIITSFSVVGS